MVGYSEVLQTMAAMVLFSLILLQSNRMILINNQQEIESSAEQRAVAIAQEFIDEARALPFDDNAVTGPPSEVPEGFSSCGSGGASRPNYDDFDDFHGDTYTKTWGPNSSEEAFQVDIQVLYVSPPDFDIADGHTGTPYTLYKKMVVTVTSPYLTDQNGDQVEITIPYLRRYYKTE